MSKILSERTTIQHAALNADLVHLWGPTESFLLTQICIGGAQFQFLNQAEGGSLNIFFVRFIVVQGGPQYI